MFKVERGKENREDRPKGSKENNPAEPEPKDE